jgi:ABC-2 type transport system permease protein
VAAVTTFGLLLLLWIVDWAGDSDIRGGSALAQLSMLRHYEPLLKGLFNSADVAYYLLVILLFTGFTIRRMDAARLQH